MTNLMARRKLYYLISAALLIPGLIALGLWGLKLGIDFTGGSLLELGFEQTVTSGQIKGILDSSGFTDSTVQIADGRVALIRTRSLVIPDGSATPTPPAEAPVVETTPQADSLDAAENANPEVTPAEVLVATEEARGINEKQDLITSLTAQFGPAKELGFESIGPVISQELTRQAVLSVLVASLAIILYIGWAFRTVPKPASSYRFGVSAIIALLHDTLFLIGVFAVMGHFMGVEVNAMFVVAVLTVMGFSVHDSIVVFDRIREKLRQQIGTPFEAVVNESVLETFGRSINTSFTVVITLLALLLFGGESIRFFTVALLLGVLVGSYSSIFNAAPILIDWQHWSERRAGRG